MSLEEMLIDLQKQRPRDLFIISVANEEKSCFTMHIRSHNSLHETFWRPVFHFRSTLDSLRSHVFYGPLSPLVPYLPSQWLFKKILLKVQVFPSVEPSQMPFTCCVPTLFALLTSPFKFHIKCSPPLKSSLKCPLLLYNFVANFILKLFAIICLIICN